VQAFPSAASLERLAGAVMCDQDDARSASRHFSEKAMAELCEEGPAGEPPTEGRAAVFRLVAQGAIDASLELADKLEAA